jgi:DNA polymerase-3 subunit gamma/tau
MFDTLDSDESHEPAKTAAPYRVLARKYRPQTFAELIGHDAMVQTLGNAIHRERLAHAFLLTGLRGVGKTSTARLIAKALNCVGPDGQGGPTIDPCGVCEPCIAIAEGRHIDVVEMDAASHTGVDDIREIIEAVRYAAVSARYKIYIIDEVHMLSKNAFNALLKTLEEPPAHVKFLFATTEVQKVPVTVLSRCQRFDLKRIPTEKLAQQFADICAKEGVEAEGEALALIARAAEGSSRDGLSILDQAIAHAQGTVTASQLREMLGLSDRGAIRTMFGLLLAGDAPSVLSSIRAQYDLGVDPVAIFRGLLETCHGVTRAKVGGAQDAALSVEERDAFADWASRLGFATLHRIWQLLLKGHGEIVSAPMPMEAAEMALLRIVYASSLPDPGELARRIAGGEAVAPATAAIEGRGASVPALSGSDRENDAQPGFEGISSQRDASAFPKDFRTLVELIDRGGKALLAQQLHDFVGLVRYEPPELVIRPVRPLGTEFTRDLTAALKVVTKQVWAVSIADGTSDPSLLEQEKVMAEAERNAVLALPVVKAAYEAFPDAELIDYSLAEQRSMNQ